jgi:hypothetical protein
MPRPPEPPPTANAAGTATPAPRIDLPAAVPQAAPAPAPQPAPARANEGDGYTALKAELGRCRGKDNFISRGLCEEKAKWRYCEPGNLWGKVPECVKTVPAEGGN